MEKNNNPKTRERPTQVWHCFWQQSQSMHVGSVKGSFQRLKGSFPYLSCYCSPDDKSQGQIHPFLWNQLLGGTICSTYSVGICFTSYSKWLLLFSPVGNLPFPIKCGFLQGYGTCHKVQEEDSMLGTEHHEIWEYMVVRHWHELPREAGDVPSWAMCKSRLYGALSHLV